MALAETLTVENLTTVRMITAYVLLYVSGLNTSLAISAAGREDWGWTLLSACAAIQAMIVAIVSLS